MGVSRRVIAASAVSLVMHSAGPAGAIDSSRRALPETVVVTDGQTSAPVVDISKVRLRASWYWDSEQSVQVTVPNGMRAGHRLTVFFDVNGDGTPDGRYELRLSKPKNKGGKWLRRKEEFRLGGGWAGAGTKVRCTGSEGGSPAVGGVRKGARSVALALDLWSCLQISNPPVGAGSWRAAVRLAKGKKADMAPSGRRWSRPVAGWGPCDPSGGAC